MNPLEKLHADHEKLFNEMNRLADRARRTPTDVSLLLSYCREYLIPHAEAEETTFYAACSDPDFAKKLMREHKEIRNKFDIIDRAFSCGELHAIPSSVEEFMTLLSEHFEKEESTLMPELSSTLSQQEIESLIEESHRIEEGKKISDIEALFDYDHNRIDLNIAELQAAKGDDNASRSLYSKVRAQLLKHLELEERIIFPAFMADSSAEKRSSIEVMSTEHRQIAACISMPPSQLDNSSLSRNLQRLIVLLAVHRKTEESILYPLANRSFLREKRDEVYRESFDLMAEV